MSSIHFSLLKEISQILIFFFIFLLSSSCKIVGIAEVKSEESSFIIAPNPTKGEFIIQSDGFSNTSVRLQIRTLSGNLVRDEQLSNANQFLRRTVDMRNSAKGIYFVSIYDGDNVIHRKLVVR